MPISPAANSVLTVDEYKFYTGDAEANEMPDDDRVIFLINIASQQLEDWCQRGFITPASAIEELFSGDDEVAYHVKHCRITETPALYSRQSDNTWLLLETPPYIIEYDGDDGVVYFVSAHRFIKAGRNSWKVAYKYGWTQATVPPPIKALCAQLVMRMVKLSAGKEGMDAQSFGDSTTSYNLADIMTAGMLRTLRPYKSHA